MTEQLFAGLLFLNQLKTTLNQACWNKKLEQSPGTELTHPHEELKLSYSKLAKEKKMGFLHFESLQRKTFSERTTTSLVTPCFVRHTYLRTDSHCSLTN